MRKISERSIEQLRGISPDELAAHGVISPAPNQRGKTGWICPLCGSGEGRNHHGRGDGAGSFDDANRFFCHACCNELIGRHKLSAIDLFSIARGLQNENFAEQCRQMANEFNVSIDFDELPDLPRRTRRRNKKFNAKIEPPIDSAELERIQQDLSRFLQILSKWHVARLATGIAQKARRQIQFKMDTTNEPPSKKICHGDGKNVDSFRRQTRLLGKVDLLR